MKIRLVAVDSKIPNFALMKISSYHKARGDDVDWYNPLMDSEDTDILYISKIFIFSEDYLYIPDNPRTKVIKGGTGYDYTSTLPDEIESIVNLDYSLYPDCDYSIVFTTRGCVRKCAFCIVPKKEGLIHSVPIVNLNPNGKWIMLLDNNFFASKDWKDRLEVLKQYNQPIDFRSGIDLRLLTVEQCKALASVKIKCIHSAWDHYEDKDAILPRLKMLCEYVNPRKITTYVLVGFENKEIVQTDLERVMTLRQIGVNPFAMGYMDYNDPTYQKSKSVVDFCRWVNRKQIFKTCTWDEYKGGTRCIKVQ